MIGTGKARYDVFIQDQTTPPFQMYFFSEDKTGIVLTSEVNIGDTSINVSNDHGFTTADHINIFENNRAFQAKITSVVGNIVNVRKPTSYSFSTNATVVRGSINLAVDSSIIPKKFYVTLPQFTVPIDIIKVIITMIHNTAGDESKFGGIAALTKGLLLQKENNVVQNLGNYYTNKTFREYGGIVEYTDKAGGGLHGTYVYNHVRDNYGVVIRLKPQENDKLVATTRDELDTLTSLQIAVIGHYTQGEG